MCNLETWELCIHISAMLTLMVNILINFWFKQIFIVSQQKVIKEKFNQNYNMDACLMIARFTSDWKNLFHHFDFSLLLHDVLAYKKLPNCQL